MKVCWFGFLSKNMSWSIVGQNICRQLISKGHEVDMFSTNGNLYFPDDLRPYLKGHVADDQPLTADLYQRQVNDKLDKNYDMQLSYTAMKNFSSYFSRGNKNRFGIWNYETTVLPKSFARHALPIDRILPSSNFSKGIFVKNGIPEEKQTVIHHGVDLDKFANATPYHLKTKKQYKIFANIAQPHLRKNIPGLLRSYGNAFTNKDDVCLVIKISLRGAQKGGENDVDFNLELKKFKEKFKNHGEIEIINNFIPDIEGLYNACDVVITMSMAECFWMPGLESFAANKITIAPRYGGQLDYMNDSNSVLIEGKTIRADLRMQYWEPSPYASVFLPSEDDCANKLKDVINHYDDYYKKFSPNMKKILPEYTWSKVTDDIIKLCS